jgi:hypothetical protein
MRLQRSFKSRYQFLRIIAVVSRSTKPLTVAEIADALGTSAASVAHCIGLHLYFESHQTSEVTIPPPLDYRAPAVTDVIDREMLNPKQPARMLAVEAAMQDALAEVVVARTLAQRRSAASRSAGPRLSPGMTTSRAVRQIEQQMGRY